MLFSNVFANQNLRRSISPSPAAARSLHLCHGDKKCVNATLLIPVIYKCPLPQPLSFDILTNARGCGDSGYLAPYILPALLALSRKKCIANRLFSLRCALFQVPYLVSPVVATLTKTAGCIPTIPILVHPGQLLRREPASLLCASSAPSASLR